MTTVLYLLLFLLRLIKPLTLSKATAVSKSQQLSLEGIPCFQVGPEKAAFALKEALSRCSAQCIPERPLPPGGRSMQVFPESWALCLA